MPITPWRPHAAVLALGTFAVGTDAFVIAGVLPSIGRSLDVSVSAAGQLVTAFSIAYALFAPVLASATANWDRRATLVVALGVFAAGNVLTAVAPAYGLVLAARIVAAAGAALYTATANATAATLAGPAERGRAIAMVMLGATASLVLGAPLGTAVGSAFGWRMTMWLLTSLGVLAGAVLAVRLPQIRPTTTSGLRARLVLLRDVRVLRLLGISAVAFIGIYMPYTYISAIYEPATNGSGDALAVLLMTFGVAGTAGNLLAGHLADRLGAARVVLGATLTLTVLFLVMPLTRGDLGAAVPMIVMVGVCSFAVTTPQQHQLVPLSPAAPALVTSLYQSSVYLAVSLSGVVGAVGLQLASAWALPLVAAVFTAAAAGMTARFRRRGSVEADLGVGHG